MVNYANDLSEKGLPVVFTLSHLAHILDIPYGYLRKVVSRKVDPYRRFNIRKRTGGWRPIEVPQPNLMRTQAWINRNILQRFHASTFATAYSRGSSPVNNAAFHSGAKWLVKVDVLRFFESVSERQVYGVFKSMGYKRLFAFELARLVTTLGPKPRKYSSSRWSASKGRYIISEYSNTHLGHLPQGAPTSPATANLVCRSLDDSLAKLARAFDCIYTRYSDDIVFSSLELGRGRAVDLVRLCTQRLAYFGFKAHVQKTQIIPPGARKIVTGLNVNSSRPSLSKEFRERIENHLYYSLKYGVADHCRVRKFRSLIGFREHLRGLIAYVSQVDPKTGADFQRQFQQLEWPDSQ